MDVLFGTLILVGFAILVWRLLALAATPEDEDVEELLGLIAGNWDPIDHAG